MLAPNSGASENSRSKGSISTSSSHGHLPYRTRIYSKSSQNLLGSQAAISIRAVFQKSSGIHLASLKRLLQTGLRKLRLKYLRKDKRRKGVALSSWDLRPYLPLRRHHHQGIEELGMPEAEAQQKELWQGWMEGGMGNAILGPGERSLVGGGTRGQKSEKEKVMGERSGHVRVQGSGLLAEVDTGITIGRNWSFV